VTKDELLEGYEARVDALKSPEFETPTLTRC